MIMMCLTLKNMRFKDLESEDQSFGDLYEKEKERSIE